MSWIPPPSVARWRGPQFYRQDQANEKRPTAPPRRCPACGGSHWRRAAGGPWRCWGYDPGPADWQRRPEIEIARPSPSDGVEVHSFTVPLAVVARGPSAARSATERAEIEAAQHAIGFWRKGDQVKAAKAGWTVHLYGEMLAVALPARRWRGILERAEKPSFQSLVTRSYSAYDFASAGLNEMNTRPARDRRTRV
jgi:hypothetical protein